MSRFWLHWLTLVRMSIQALASTQLLAWMYSARSGWMTWNIFFILKDSSSSGSTARMFSMGML